MTLLTFHLRPRTAFATPFFGDTLFGQLCWAIRHGWGEARLKQLLDGYREGFPFAVVSDAFPSGYLPLPALPAAMWAGEPANAKQRKELKQKIWLPHSALAFALETWQEKAAKRDEIGIEIETRLQPRNSLNRLTHTTGEGDGFSPYTVRQYWYSSGAVLDVHVCLDESRLSASELHSALAAIGEYGFGKDASVGLGKFDIQARHSSALTSQTNANAWFTLAPCAPQGLAWDAKRCFFRLFVRYGRHGDLAARQASPFKAPILLAATGALLTPRTQDDWARGWVGQGLGGDGSLSKTIEATVHQGYAPAIAVHLPERSDQEAA